MYDFIRLWVVVLGDYIEPFDNIISAIIGGLIVSVLGPRFYILSEYIRKRESRKHENLRKRITRRERYATLKKENRITSKRLKKFKYWLFCQMVKRTILIAFIFFVPLFLVAGMWVYSKHDTNENRKTMHRLFEEQKSSMYFKTTRKFYPGEKIDITRQQLICKLKAMVESGKDIYSFHLKSSIAYLVYQSCMLQGGWFTSECSQGEKDCVEISFYKSGCESETREWLKDKSNRNELMLRLCERRRRNIYSRR